MFFNCMSVFSSHFISSLKKIIILIIISWYKKYLSIMGVGAVTVAGMALELAKTIIENNKGENTIQKHYMQDPSILQKIEDSKRQIAVLKEAIEKLQQSLKQSHSLAQKFKDPKFYKQCRQQAFKMFLENIDTLNFKQKIHKKEGQRHHVLVGNISSGKTSMINYACKTNLPVGVGQTTDKVRKVACSADNVFIWDSPGVNQDFAFCDVEVLAYFHSADRIFILYPDSLKSCKELIQVLYKIKPSNTFLVRTQCDRFQSQDFKNIKQELQEDALLLQKWGIKLQILATSCKRSHEFQDNKRFSQLLLGRDH